MTEAEQGSGGPTPDRPVTSAVHEAAGAVATADTGSVNSAVDADAKPEAAVATPIGQALTGLERLPDLDLAEHADVYQHIHGELQRALAAIDDA